MFLPLKDHFGDASGFTIMVHSDSNFLYPSFLTFNTSAASGNSPSQSTGANINSIMDGLNFGYVPGNEIAAFVLVAPEGAGDTQVQLTLYGPDGQIDQEIVTLTANTPYANIVSACI